MALTFSLAPVGINPDAIFCIDMCTYYRWLKLMLSRINK